MASDPMTAPGPVPAVPRAPDREADLTHRVEAAIFDVAIADRYGPRAVAEVIYLVREQVARDIEREHDPGAGFADTWNRAVKRCAAIARGALS